MYTSLFPMRMYDTTSFIVALLVERTVSAVCAQLYNSARCAVSL
jgi:hypothetical protein